MPHIWNTWRVNTIDFWTTLQTLNSKLWCIVLSF